MNPNRRHRAAEIEDEVSKRNTVYAVSLTTTYPSDVTPAEVKEGKRADYDVEDTVNVMAADAEDAITRAKAFIDKRDKADKSYTNRLSLVVNGVREVVKIDVA